MKKLVAMLLAVLMVFAMAACSPINDTEVSILWADDGVVKIPNSLINAMERAMYTKNIEYAHYGAKGDQAAQTKQAEEALSKGCVALVVELVDPSAAQAIVDLAKARNVPVIFMNCQVDAAVLSGYDKCVLVDTDASSVGKVQGEQIAELLTTENKGLFGGSVTYEEYEKMDRNDDGKISYMMISADGPTGAVSVVDEKLLEKGLKTLDFYDADNASKNLTVEEAVAQIAQMEATEADKTKKDAVALLGNVELIITADDTAAQAVFNALQARGFNKDKLTTHCIPVYTIGNSADYKALVLADRPAGEHDSDAVQEYYKSMQYVVDLRNIAEEDMDTYIYTTGNMIEDGRLAGTVVEDHDSIAATVTSIISNMIKGEDTFKGVENAQDKQVLIPYVAQ